ncbi:MAG: lysophospholipid acyltransferase family protein [Nitrospiria bacterium]
MKGKAAYFAIRLLSAFVRTLPFDTAVNLGAMLGRLLHRVDRRHRLIGLNNLKAAFKNEKSEQELADILSNVYQNIGRSGIEAIRLARLTADEIRARTEIEGFEYYKAARTKNKGVILLGAHFGSWEWIPLALGEQGAPMHVIVRPIDNPYLNQMVQKMRERFGNVVLNKRSETGEIIKLLRQGKSIGFLLDQDVGHSKAIFVDYFGRPAATNKALATIALRTGAPVVPMFIIRKKGGHRLVIEKPLPLPRTGNLKQDMIGTTTLFTKKIESYVRQHPDHWLWLHRRWKTQPEERPAGSAT